MTHKNNTKHQLTWRHKSPENLEVYRATLRRYAKKSYEWNKIRMIFLRILL